MDLRRLSI